MTVSLLTLAAVLIGVFLQVFLLLRTKNHLLATTLIIAACVTVVILAPLQIGPVNFTLQVLLFSIFFCVVFALVFKDLLLVQIDERLTLYFTLIFHYALFSHFNPLASGFLNTLWLVSLFPSSIIVIESLFSFEYQFLRKLFQYVWFLTIDVALILVYIFSDLLFPPRGLIDGFFFGTALFFLVTNGTYLFRLIPIPSKEVPFSQRLRQLIAHTRELVAKHSDTQLHRREALLIILVFGGLLLINYYVELLPHWLVVDLSILISLRYASPSTMRTGHHRSKYSPRWYS